jgi:hypothetical protein
MDFTKAITISTGTATSAYLNLNSITAAPAASTPFSGYIVESLTYSRAQVAGFVDPLAQRDGVDTDIATLPQRQTAMIVQVYGSTQADFYDKLNDLNEAFQPYPDWASLTDGFRSLKFSQPTGVAAYSAIGIPLQIGVRPLALPDYTLHNDITKPRTSDRGVTTRATVQLMSRDPRKISQTTTTSTIALSSGSATSTFTHNGNYYAYPTFTIVTALTTAATLTISSDIFTASLSIGTGSNTTILDTDARTVTVNGTLTMSTVKSATTKLPYIDEGVNTIYYAFTGGGPYPASIKMTYQEAWI